MATTNLVLVNGLPGTGKTTLAAKLKADLALPCLGKDMLKEFLFDTIATGGAEESKLLGKIVSEMQYHLAEEYARTGRSIILESAYFVEFARPAFANIAEKYPVQIIEIYCTTEPSVRRARFRARVENGQRHAAHVADIQHIANMKDDLIEPLDTYAPIEVGKLIKVDTTNFGNTEYTKLVQAVTDCLGPPAD